MQLLLYCKSANKNLITFSTVGSHFLLLVLSDPLASEDFECRLKLHHFEI